MSLLLTRDPGSLTSGGREGNSVLQLAVMGGHLDTVRLCLSAGQSVDTTNHLGDTALHLAAGLYTRPEERSRDLVLELLNAGADINCRNSDGETPIYSAVRTGTTSVMRSILS